jgi:ABC-type spermidine/putrescine transport system permease subunit I
MESRKTIYFGMFIGGLIGGYVPSFLWGAGTFSFSALLGNASGAIIGIYIAFKLTR